MTYSPTYEMTKKFCPKEGFPLDAALDATELLDDVWHQYYGAEPVEGWIFGQQCIKPARTVGAAVRLMMTMQPPGRGNYSAMDHLKWCWIKGGIAINGKRFEGARVQ